MKRRDFLKFITTLFLSTSLYPARTVAGVLSSVRANPKHNYDEDIKDYLYRMRNFDNPHKGDLYLSKKEYLLLQSSVKRLKRLQSIVGHGNFHLLSLDSALKTARNYPAIGRFTRSELEFMEMVFHKDAAQYGFYGEKPITSMSAAITNNRSVKVPFSGNYLYKGKPHETYKQIIKIVGNKVVLTSGIRGVVKQFYLFLNKVYKNRGNVSLASRSLAPPGYSFHGIGDFDVGQVGFGASNFTERFITTELYKKLEDLGYLKLRYPMENHLGVRYEPWHIKIT